MSVSTEADTVCFPILKTNPTKFVPASTCHMVTPLIFFDRIFTFWAYLKLNNLNPFVLVITNHLFPVLEFRTMDGRVINIATKSANSCPTRTINGLHSEVSDEEEFATVCIWAHFNSCILAGIENKYQMFKLFFYFHIFRVV